MFAEPLFCHPQRVQIKRTSVRKFMISVLIADYRLPLQQSPNPGAREKVGRQEGDGNFSNAFDLLNMAAALGLSKVFFLGLISFLQKASLL